MEDKFCIRIYRVSYYTVFAHTMNQITQALDKTEFTVQQLDRSGSKVG